MSQHAARILRNLQRHIETNGSNDPGTIAVLKQVVGILTKKPKPIPQKRTKARRGPMRDPKYRRWCRKQECAILREMDSNDDRSDVCVDDPALMFNACDPAHTQNNGMRSKGPDSSCVPLCRKHHQEYDAGRAAFEKKYGVNMKKLAAEHYARYQAEARTE